MQRGGVEGCVGIEWGRGRLPRGLWTIWSKWGRGRLLRGLWMIWSKWGRGRGRLPRVMDDMVEVG